MAQLRVQVQLKGGRVTIHPGAYQQLLADDSSGVLREMMRRGQNVLAEMYRQVPTDTGLLAATLRLQARTPGGGYGVVVAAGQDGVTDYLGYILDGTPPHVIRPRRKKALRFVAGGRVVFSKRVNHPGTAANNFILRSLPAANR